MLLNRVFSSVLTLMGSLAALALVWAAAIFLVGPRGEFFVNDDWSFVKAFESFVASGRVTSTGWGPNYAPGGPALLVHLLWGRLFTLFAGQSITVLRISVLVMGILGSLGMLVLLRRAGCAALPSLMGALAVVVNPLYLSQSFTYMSDVTFAALSVYALLFLLLAAQTRSLWLLAAGFGVCLAAILVRQIGAAIVAAFLWMCLVHPRGRDMGFTRSLLTAAVVVFVPWFFYEYLLFSRGGTHILQHQVVQNMVRNCAECGSWSGYVRFVSCNALGVLLYCGLFTSPIWILRFGQFMKKKGFLVFLGCAVFAFAAAQLGILTGSIEPPVFFWPNIIFDFGIGPILLKDTAILGISRQGHLPAWAYYIWALVATLGVGIILGRGRIAIAGLFKREGHAGQSRFIADVAFWSALFYTCIICASGFHDRYLIPLFIWLLVWLAVEDPERGTPVRSPGMIAASAAIIGVIGVLSVVCTRDFMEMKRTLLKAQRYVAAELRLAPCSIDGGFEFNGYHCYQSTYRPTPGKSWWWVHDEKAVLTLGPLPGYQVERVFPFRRWLGPDGAVHVLIPASGG
jgi:hypothetical protein